MGCGEACGHLERGRDFWLSTVLPHLGPPREGGGALGVGAALLGGGTDQQGGARQEGARPGA